MVEYSDLFQGPNIVLLSFAYHIFLKFELQESQKIPRFRDSRDRGQRFRSSCPVTGLIKTDVVYSLGTSEKLGSLNHRCIKVVSMIQVLYLFPSLKLTCCTWKWMFGILVSLWNCLFSEAMLVSGRVLTTCQYTEYWWKCKHVPKSL